MKYRGHLHKGVWVWPILWVIVSLLVYKQGGDAKASGVFLFVILVIPSTIRAAIILMTSEFAVTNRRVIVKGGFISRFSVEALIPRIEGVLVTEGILGRILGYGTVTVLSAGGAQVFFRNITNPRQFRRAVQEQIDRIESRNTAI